MKTISKFKELWKKVEKFIKIDQKEYSYRVKIFISYSVGIFCGILALAFFCIRMFEYYTTQEIDRYIVSICLIFSSCVFFSDVFVFLYLWQKNEIFFVIFFCYGVIFLVTVQYFNGFGFNSSSPYVSLYGIIFIFKTGSKYFFIYVFLYYIVSIGFFVYDIIILPEIINLRSAYVIMGLIQIMWFFLIIFVSFFEFYLAKRNLSLLRQISLIVSNLNFSDPKNNKLLVSLRKVTKINSPMSLVYIKNIIEKMFEYKSYLPLTLVRKNENSDESLSSDNSSSVSSSYDSKSEEDSSGATYSSGYSIDSERNFSGLFRTTTSFFVCDLIGFTDIASKLNDIDLVEFHTDYLTTVCSIIEVHRGNVTHFDSGIVYASFNAIKKCVTFKKNACESALVILKRFRKKNYTFTGDEESEEISIDLKEKIKITISTGECIASNFGNNSIKRFNIVGELVQRNKKMNNYLNKKCGMIYDILIDENTENSVKFNYRTRIVDIIEDMFVFNLYGSKKLVESMEWNYVIEKDLRTPSDENKWLEVIEDCWRSYKKENYEKCIEDLEKYYFEVCKKENKMDDSTKRLVKLLKKMGKKTIIDLKN